MREGRPRIEKIRILLVDDEEMVCRSFKRIISSDDVEVEVFQDPVKALRALEGGKVFDIVIADFKMDNMNGVEFLEHVRDLLPDAVRMIITGYMDMQIAADAVNKVGVYKIILKPWKIDELKSIINEAVALVHMTRLSRNAADCAMGREEAVKKVRDHLDYVKSAGILDSLARKMHSDHVVKETALAALKSIVTAFELRDAETVGHSFQVAKLTRTIAEKAEYPSEHLDGLEVAALLHDIGKISIPENILLKKGKLTPEEYNEMKKHPLYGARIVEGLEWPPMLRQVILEHHEWYNGNGYPFGLSGEEISLEGRIVMIADTISAMLQQRSYRTPRTLEDVRRELLDKSGIQFDPHLARVALRILDEMGEDGYRQVVEQAREAGKIIYLGNFREGDHEGFNKAQA